jgi:endonuclease/exonuclease/phosphatase (EEP) superfamily protein YafD
MPLEEPQIQFVGQSPSPVVTAAVLLDDKRLSIVGAHPDPPHNFDAVLQRNDQLKKLAELIITMPTPLVLAGDLNTSSFNPVYKRLVEDTGLRDSRRGFGVQASWPTSWALMRTTIDHVLISPRVRVIDRRVGPYIGSDHFPVVIDLLVK